MDNSSLVSLPGPLEQSIADACPLVEDALCIASLFRTLTAHALESSEDSADGHQRLITAENYWRARRFGVAAHFLNGTGTKLNTIERWLHVAEERLVATFCESTVFARARQIVAIGSSADRQVALFNQARAANVDAQEALVRVARGLIEETAR